MADAAGVNPRAVPSFRDPAQASPSALRVRLLVALLCLLWGSTWLVIAEGLRDLPPLTSAGARFALAFLVMVAIAPRLHRREGGVRPPAWLWLVVGGLNFGVSYAIVYMTETLLPSGLVSVLWAVFPLMMAVAGHGWLDEHMSLRQWGGLVLGLAGVASLFLTDLQAFGPEALPTALLLLLSPLVCVIGQTCLKRHGAGVSSVLVNRNAMGFGALLLVCGALFFERDAPAVWTGSALFSVVWLAVFGTVVTFSLLFWLLRHAPATQLSMIAFITPVLALLLGALVAGEPVTGTTVGGAGLVVLGVALAVLRPATRA
jgi:drug/metabolite transporter (DMT)-like permease